MAEDQAVRNDDSMCDAKMEVDVEVIATTEAAADHLEDAKKNKLHQQQQQQVKLEEEEEEEDGDVDAQLEKYKERLKIVEQQSKQLKSEGTGTVSGTDNGVAAIDAAGKDAYPISDNDLAIATVDARSVYVGNVDYGATVSDLSVHFSDCGAINRVTIMCNKATGTPKGFAYIEFTDAASVKHATVLDGTTFRQRKLKVVAKRTNIPGLSYRGRPRPRYRGRGRGRARRGFRPRGWAPY